MSFNPIFWIWCAWGYCGCGYLASRRQGWRGGSLVIGAFLSSLAILFPSALLLQLLGLRISPGSWLGVTALLAALACLLPGRDAAEDRPAAEGQPVGRAVIVLLLASVLLAIGVIAYRAVAQPLTGPDTIFRWNFLARQILRTGGMSFCPPVSPADFEHYMWADGIPPLVPLTYLWAYMGAGSDAAVGTAPIVLLSSILIFGIVWLLASRVSGRAAALWSAALLSGSAINTWSVSMGQESALAAVALLSLAWGLGGGKMDWRLAGLAAGVAALSRDYALATIPVGAFLLIGAKRPLREAAAFAGLAACLCGTWYLRNWVRTGNPVYNVDVLGLFRLSPVHADMMRSYVARYGFTGHLRDRLSELLALLWPLGAAVILAAAAGMREIQRHAASVPLLAVAWIFLWAGSVGYTAGGIGYSLRVLAPALALLAVVGGTVLARSSRWAGLMLALLLTAIAAEASARALLMMRSPVSVPMGQWAHIGDRFSAANGNKLHDRAAVVIGAHGVLVDDAYTHAYLVNRGVRAVPLWSPGMAYLLSPDRTAKESVRRLHSEGVDFIWLTASQEPRQYFDRFRFFQELDPLLVPVLVGDNWILFGLK